MPAALDPYPDPEARDRETARLAQAAGGECLRYGNSVQGRPLWAVRLSSQRANPPRVLVTAGIHGVEYIGVSVALGLLRHQDTAQVAALRAQAELWVIPCLNPDGYARTWDSAGQGTVAALRANARGVDLNRNFPLPPGRRRLALPGAGSDKPGAATYVGPTPLSEPESAALDTLMSEQRFVAAMGCHSFLGRLIPAHVVDRPAFAVYRALCRTFQRQQPMRRYPRLHSRWFDTFTGELEDHQHHRHGMWAVCLESFTIPASLRQHLRAPNTFFRFNPRDPQPWVQNDVPAMAAFLHAALDQPHPAR